MDFNIYFLIVLPIELPIVLPIVRAKGPGPGRLGLGGPRVLGRTGLAWGAKGPGPDRLGLGGQGSWAGPAWLGGPRVLGRAGLVLHYFNIMVLLYIILS